MKCHQCLDAFSIIVTTVADLISLQFSRLAVAIVSRVGDIVLSIAKQVSVF